MAYKPSIQRTPSSRYCAITCRIEWTRFNYSTVQADSYCCRLFATPTLRSCQLPAQFPVLPNRCNLICLFGFAGESFNTRLNVCHSIKSFVKSQVLFTNILIIYSSLIYCILDVDRLRVVHNKLVKLGLKEEMMIKKYKIPARYVEAKIETVEVIRETEHCVFLPHPVSRHNSKGEVKELKVSDWYEYHDTWESAHTALLKKAERKLTSARDELQKIQGLYGNIKGMAHHVGGGTADFRTPSCQRGCSGQPETGTLSII